MKKPAISAAIFFLGAVSSYVGLCYLVPGLRIKLAADTGTYFVESLRHMVFLKGVISLAIGAALAGVPLLISKGK